MASGVHLAIDAVGMRRASGGTVVLGELLEGLLATPTVERIVLYASPASQREFSLPEAPQLRVRTQDVSGSRMRLLEWARYGLDAECRADGVQGLVSLNALGVSRLPTVVLFQQQLMFAPDALRLMPLPFRMRLFAMRRMARRVCRNARLVIAQASHVASSLTHQFGVDPRRVRVVMPDVRWPAIASAPAPVPFFRRPTLLYVGTDRPYKSLNTALEALALLRCHRPELRLAVTLPAGHRVSRFSGVDCLGTVPRATVRLLLREAAALVMPSLAETLGLPLLEALDVGCPIAAADLSYARDVCEDAAVYFRAADPVSCAEACETLLSARSTAIRLVAAGHRRIDTIRASQPTRLLAEAIVHAVSGSGHGRP